MPPQTSPASECTQELVFRNARLLLEDEVMTGSLRVQNGIIADIAQGASAIGLDCNGDYLCPGLIELHTDNLERHMQPRPGVRWPLRQAVLSHDRELASVGISTVFDALRVGSIVSDDRARHQKYARPVLDEILTLRAGGVLKLSHFAHLRAEVCSETLIEELDEFSPADRIGIISIMDHTPGQRQFRDLSKMNEYLIGKYGMARADIDVHYRHLRDLQSRLGGGHMAHILKKSAQLQTRLASHDDTTIDDVDMSVASGVNFAEFPTTLEAAKACHANGIAVMMGAPNVIRGGSHSGNVSAIDLADAGLLDILSSDYAPSSLLSGAVLLGQRMGNIASGIHMVTAAPAAAVGLKDRGCLRPGLRADLLRFGFFEDCAQIQGLWVLGERV